MDNTKVLLDIIYNKGVSIEEIKAYYDKRQEKEKYSQYTKDCAEARLNMLTMLKKYLKIIAPDADIDFASFIKELKNIENDAYKGNVDIKLNIH